MFIELSRDREGRAHVEIEDPATGEAFSQTFAGDFVVREEPVFTASFPEDGVLLRVDIERGMLEVLELPGMATLFEGSSDSRAFLQTIIDELRHGAFPRFAAYSDDAFDDFNNGNDNSQATQSVANRESIVSNATNISNMKNMNSMSIGTADINVMNDNWMLGGGKKRRRRTTRAPCRKQRQRSQRSQRSQRQQRRSRRRLRKLRR